MNKEFSNNLEYSINFTEIFHKITKLRNSKKFKNILKLIIDHKKIQKRTTGQVIKTLVL